MWAHEAAARTGQVANLPEGLAIDGLAAATSSGGISACTGGQQSGRECPLSIQSCGQAYTKAGVRPYI